MVCDELLAELLGLLAGEVCLLAELDGIPADGGCLPVERDLMEVLMQLAFRSSEKLPF